MAHTTEAVFVGGPSNLWSTESNWASGSVPHSSNGLKVQVDASGTQDLGTASKPFLTHDIVGINGETLGLPTIFDSGFLSAHDVSNLSSIDVAGPVGSSGAGLHVTHDLENVGNVSLDTGGRFAGGNPTAEIGHSVGDTSFLFTSRASVSGIETLILDRPPEHDLANPVNVSSVAIMATAKIELGGVKFDAADLLPPLPGQPRQVQLTNHGQPVYTLDNVSLTGGAASAMVSFGGVDPRNGYDTLLFHSG